MKGEFDFPVKRALSEDLKDLLSKMLEINPNKRIDIEMIFKHKWLSEINFHSFTMQHVNDFEKNQNNYLCNFKHEINDFVLNQMLDLGFTKEIIEDTINNKTLNLASSCYYNIEKDFV